MHIHTTTPRKASGSRNKGITVQERAKHCSPSHFFHAMRGAGSAEGAQLHTMFLLQDEEREDIITGHMEIVKSAIESVFAMRLEDIVRNSCKNCPFLNELLILICSA